MITRIDTIAREKPVYYAVRQTDTLRVVVRDTVRQQDTLYLELRREQRAYRDTSFEAWVSGVEPALDSIRVFSPVRCVTVTERVPVKVRSRWGLGVSAGYGITLTKEPQLTPYLGAAGASRRARQHGQFRGLSLRTREQPHDRRCNEGTERGAGQGTGR